MHTVGVCTTNQDVPAGTTNAAMMMQNTSFFLLHPDGRVGKWNINPLASQLRVSVEKIPTK